LTNPEAIKLAKSIGAVASDQVYSVGNIKNKTQVPIDYSPDIRKLIPEIRWPRTGKMHELFTELNTIPQSEKWSNLSSTPALLSGQPPK